LFAAVVSGDYYPTNFLLGKPFTATIEAGSKTRRGKVFTIRYECVRQKAGRHKHPTTSCIDSQSVKTTALLI